MRDFFRVALFILVMIIGYGILIAASIRQPLVDQRRFLKLRHDRD